MWNINAGSIYSKTTEKLKEKTELIFNPSAAFGKEIGPSCKSFTIKASLEPLESF